MSKYYLNDWKNSSQEEILDEFEVEINERNINILFASYTFKNWTGEAFLIVEKDGKLFEVHAEHCSCYGLEYQFRLEETTIEQLEFYLENGKIWDYYHKKDFIKEQFIDFIKNYKEELK